MRGRFAARYSGRMDAILFDMDDTLYDQALPFARAVRKVLGEWLDQFGTARHYVGLNFGSHPLEYKVLYELSRKLYNP